MPGIFQEKETVKEEKEDYQEEDKIDYDINNDSKNTFNGRIGNTNGRRGGLSHSLIKYKTGEYDLELVKRIDLQGNDLLYVENLEECYNLLDINLSRNLIRNLNFCFQYNISLKRLDLSYNQITDLRYNGNDISLHLTNLEYLNLQGNRISSFDDCLDCLKNLPKLTTLYLRENPLMKRFTSSTVSSTSSSTVGYASPLISDSGQHLSNSVSQNRPNYFEILIANVRSLEILDGECVRMRQLTESRLSQLLLEIEPDDEARQYIPRSPWLENTESHKYIRETKRETGGCNRQESTETKNVDDQEKQLSDNLTIYMDTLESMKSKADSLLSSLQNEVNQLNCELQSGD